MSKQTPITYSISDMLNISEIRTRGVAIQLKLGPRQAVDKRTRLRLVIPPLPSNARVVILDEERKQAAHWFRELADSIEHDDQALLLEFDKPHDIVETTPDEG